MSPKRHYPTPFKCPTLPQRSLSMSPFPSVQISVFYFQIYLQVPNEAKCKSPNCSLPFFAIQRRPNFDVWAACSSVIPDSFSVLPWAIPVLFPPPPVCRVAPSVQPASRSHSAGRVCQGGTLGLDSHSRFLVKSIRRGGAGCSRCRVCQSLAGIGFAAGRQRGAVCRYQGFPEM